MASALQPASIITAAPPDPNGDQELIAHIASGQYEMLHKPSSTRFATSAGWGGHESGKVTKG